MRIMLSILLLMALLSISSVFAQQDPQILAESDFEKPAVPPTIGVNGNWEIIEETGGNGILSGEGVDWNDYIYFPDGLGWTDYAFEFDLNIVSGSVYIDVRVGESSCDAYEVLIAPTDRYINMMTIAAGDEDLCDTVNTLDENDNYSFVNNTWTKVRLEVVGNQLKFYINNKLQLEGTDNTYANGEPRLTLAPESSAAIDNLVVTNLGTEIVATNNATPTATTAGTTIKPTATPGLPFGQPSATPALGTTNTKPTATPGLPFGQPSATPGLGTTNNTAATTLTNFRGTHQQAIAELEQKGLVRTGGRLLFVEDYAWFEGDGYWYTPLAANSPRTNVVIAGDMTFESGSTEYEDCGLLGRVVTVGSRAEESLSIALTNDGGVLVFDDFGDAEPVSYFQALNLDFTQPHHLMFILEGTNATVFVDGQLALEDVQVEQRPGSFGISLYSVAASSRCEGRNIWVYSYD